MTLAVLEKRARKARWHDCWADGTPMPGVALTGVGVEVELADGVILGARKARVKTAVGVEFYRPDPFSYLTPDQAREMLEGC